MRQQGPATRPQEAVAANTSVATSACRHSYRDALLVSVASSVLVWQAWSWTAPERPVSLIVDGKACLVDFIDAEQDVDAVQRELAARFPARPDGFSGIVRWQQEVAEFYAADNVRLSERIGRQPQSGQALSEKPVDADLADETVRFVAARTTGADNQHRLRSADATAQQALRWQEFWTRRAARAGDWLTRSEARRRTQFGEAAAGIVAQRESGRATGMPARVVVWSVFVALVMFVVARFWQRVQPRRDFFASPSATGDSVREATGGPRLADVADGWSTDGGPSMMLTFRRRWIAVRQPWGVRLRQIAGFGVVVAAFASICLRQLLA